MQQCRIIGSFESLEDAVFKLAEVIAARNTVVPIVNTGSHLGLPLAKVDICVR